MARARLRLSRRDQTTVVVCPTCCPFIRIGYGSAAARSRITVKHYPSDAALGTILGDASQGFCANVVQRAIQTAVGIQIALQWVVGSRHFVAVRKQASLNALDEVGAARSDVELLSGIPKRIPQLLTQRALIEVDLKPPCLL